MDASLPIDVYFQRIDDCVQYTVDGKVAYTADQILQTGYHGISTSGLYNDSCKDWRKKPNAEKTWNNFKRFFAAEYHDLKEQLCVNNTQKNFHGANAAVDITTALDNLAMAATLDRSTVKQLTRANLALTMANKTLTDQLQVLTATNAQLASPNQGAAGNNQRQLTPEEQAEWEARLDPLGYCWTHGYCVVCGHTSANCKRKLQGHKDNATCKNIMGGLTQGHN